MSLCCETLELMIPGILWNLLEEPPESHVEEMTLTLFSLLPKSIFSNRWWKIWISKEARVGTGLWELEEFQGGISLINNGG